ncbi:MAG: NAD(P)-binding domain-containing protein, partial [Armatimonadetes bacterium]|nr:NAD(P)-binding domain-containing protein [Armatimonadota bacterium]
MATIYSEADIDPGIVRGRTVAIIGYGNQGRAQALNLRDRGVTVAVGQRTGGAGWDSAVADGLAPVSIADAAELGEIVMLTLPD